MRKKTQVEKVQDKIRSQFSLVSKKFKTQSNTREVTNQDIQIALYQYSSSLGHTNEYGEKNQEWLHERLTRLTEKQMEIIRLRFFEAYSLSEIAEYMMMGYPITVSRELDKIYAILVKD